MKVKLLFIIISFFVLATACNNNKLASPVFENIETNSAANGIEFDITFLKGKQHNHPTFAFWIEDIDGKYIETLFVTKYLGTGIFGHGALGEGKWDNKPGEAKRPASLPYWLHKRGIMADGKTYLPTSEKPVSDAITGATPQTDFMLKTKSTKQLPNKFRLLMEINQPWDWNSYWNNGLYPNDADYKTSCQPALIYAVTIDQSKTNSTYYLNPIGHSHYSGKDGEIYTDLSTLTTAKDIVYKLSVKLKK